MLVLMACCSKQYMVLVGRRDKDRQMEWSNLGNSFSAYSSLVLNMCSLEVVWCGLYGGGGGGG